MTKNIRGFSMSEFLSFGLVCAMALFLIIGMPLMARAEVINRQLELGMSGTDVSALQAFLAQDSTLYPQGLVTGYFGFRFLVNTLDAFC